MKFPKIISGIACEPDGKVAFDIKQPNLKIFYERFIEEFVCSYYACKDVTGLLYPLKEMKLIALFGATIGAIALLSGNKIQTAKEKLDETVSKNNDLLEKKDDLGKLTDMISNIVGIRLKAWVGTFEEYKKFALTALGAVTAVGILYKTKNIMETQSNANNFLSHFNDFNHHYVKNVISKNLAEYFTFRFEQTILNLSDEKTINDFAAHFIKCLNFNLMRKNASTMHRHISLKNKLISACMSKPPNKNYWGTTPDIYLWTNGGCYGACYCSFFRTPKNVHFKNGEVISYEDIKFSSPIKYISLDKDEMIIQENFQNKQRQLGLYVNDSLPPQKVISEEEVINMGFSLSDRPLPLKSKL